MVSMNKEPLLSVIVPVYNVESYLKRCLDSIIGQTYTNLDIICIDDGSTDDSGVILDEYAKRDSRIRVVHRKNSGVVSARKEATMLARGSFLASVDSDDWIEPNMYEEVMQCVIEYKPDVVTTQEIRDYGKYSVKVKTDFKEGCYVGDELLRLKERLIETEIFFKCNISGHVCDKIFLTEKYREYQSKVPDSITIGEDPAVAYPLILGASKVFVLNRNYYHYCLRADSIMGRENYCINEDKFGFDKYAKESFFENGKGIDNIASQVSALILYQRLFGDLKETMYYDGSVLFPYGEVVVKDKVAIYGAGKFGVRLHDFLEQSGWFEKLGWFDTEGTNGAEKINESIKRFNKILVGAIHADAVDDIKMLLLEYGVSESNILTIHNISDNPHWDIISN